MCNAVLCIAGYIISVVVYPLKLICLLFTRLWKIIYNTSRKILLGEYCYNFTETLHHNKPLTSLTLIKIIHSTTRQPIQSKQGLGRNVRTDHNPNKILVIY